MSTSTRFETASNPTQAKSTAFDRIRGESVSLQLAKSQAKRYAAHPNVPILLSGQTGVGKELFARAIHEVASSDDRPFVAINCGSLSKDLLSSELFGYARGAYTGAKPGGNVGKLEAANGGTLFLDEFGELPSELQPHLLRVLEDGEYYRLGESKPRHTRFRLLTATNKDLHNAIEVGEMRRDLYFRVAVANVEIPPLQERGDDVHALCDYFLKQAQSEYNLPTLSVDDSVRSVFHSYAWPGNVRELRNTVIAMSLACDSSTILFEHLPLLLQQSSSVAAFSSQAKQNQSRGDKKKHQTSAAPIATKQYLTEIERDALIKAMELHNGNLSSAARVLGMPKSTLHYKLKRFGIRRTHFLSFA